MNDTYIDTNMHFNETTDHQGDPLKTSKINSIMKNIAREMKVMMQRIPEILCFTFESYLLGYKYQELSEMAKMAFTSLKTQQEDADGLWNFKNWGKKK